MPAYLPEPLTLGNRAAQVARLTAARALGPIGTLYDWTLGRFWMYPLMNMLRAGAKYGPLVLSDPELLAEAYARGLTLEEKSRGSDVLKMAGVKSPAARGIGGFVMDVLLDPTTYLTFGGTTATGKASRAFTALASRVGADEAARILSRTAKGQRILRTLEEAAARYGPEARMFGETLAEQAARGQRALLSTSIGRRPIIPGTRVFKGMTAAGEALRGTKLGATLGKAFIPGFGVPPSLRATEVEALRQYRYLSAKYGDELVNLHKQIQALANKYRDPDLPAKIIAYIETKPEAVAAGMRKAVDIPPEAVPIAERLKNILGSVHELERQYDVATPTLAETRKLKAMQYRAKLAGIVAGEEEVLRRAYEPQIKVLRRERANLEKLLTRTARRVDASKIKARIAYIDRKIEQLRQQAEKAAATGRAGAERVVREIQEPSVAVRQFEQAVERIPRDLERLTQRIDDVTARLVEAHVEDLARPSVLRTKRVTAKFAQLHELMGRQRQLEELRDRLTKRLLRASAEERKRIGRQLAAVERMMEENLRRAEVWQQAIEAARQDIKSVLEETAGRAEGAVAELNEKALRNIDEWLKAISDKWEEGRREIWNLKQVRKLTQKIAFLENIAPIADADYFPHILTPEARHALKGAFFGLRGEVRARHASQLARRLFNSLGAYASLEEAEAAMRRMYPQLKNVKEIFIRQPAFAVAERTKRGLRALTNARFFREAVARFGEELPPESLALPEYTGWRTLSESALRGLNPQLRDKLSKTYFHPEIADHLERLVALSTVPEESQELAKFLGKVVSTYKAWTLGPWPAYHMRNLQSDAVRIWVAGVNNPMRYAEAAKVLWGRNLKNWALDTAEGVFAGPEGRERLLDLAKQMGVLDVGRYAADIEWFASAYGGRGTRLYNLLNAPARKALAAGKHIENLSRMAMFLDQLHKGNTLAGAAQETIKVMFDYSAAGLTPFERALRNYIIPFWVWTRNNIPLQIRNLFVAPGKMTAQVHALEELSKATGIEREPAMPTYLHEMAPVYIGRGRYLPTTARLPIADIAELRHPVQKILLDVLPLYRIPFELALNKQLFTGQPIERFAGEKVPLMIPGIPAGRRPQIPAKLEYVLRQFRPYGEPMRMVKLAEQAGLPTSLVGFLTGQRVFTVDIARQARGAAMRLREYMGDLKIAMKRAAAQGNTRLAAEYAQLYKDAQRLYEWCEALGRYGAQ